MRAWKPWFTSTRGIVSGLSSSSHSLPSSRRIGARRISTSGRMAATGPASNAAPGFGSSMRISAIMSARSSASTSHSSRRRRMSRRASRSRLSSKPASPGRAGCGRPAGRTGTPAGPARTGPAGRSAACARAPAPPGPARSRARRPASALSTGTRPAGSSRAIRWAPIRRSTGSVKLRRSCWLRCSRSERGASARSSMPRSSPSKPRPRRHRG